MKVSVIIPVLNEMACLPQTLAALRPDNWIHEVIAVDGGSTDGTLQWLRQQKGVKMLEAPAGKGVQLNAGAKVATGDVLLFLHADTQLPADAQMSLRKALDSPRAAGGAFCLKYDLQRSRLLRVVAEGINLRTLLTRTATGDQAIFIRAEAFREIEGFREWPLFEDVDLVSRMSRVGRFVTVRSRVTVSARRYLRKGLLRTVLLVYLLRLGYWAGISPFTLAKWYQGTNDPPQGEGPSCKDPQASR